MTVMTKKKSAGSGRARERGDTTTFTFELPPRLNAAFEACAEKQRRTKKAILSLALEAYLAQYGFWPPDGESQP